MNNKSKRMEAVPTYLQRLGLGLAILAAGCVALAGAVDLIGFSMFSDERTSGRAAAWVQAIGVPFAVVVTYLAASMQVKALRVQRREDIGHQEAAHLLHLHELTGWIATSVANTLVRRHQGGVGVESAAMRGLAVENILSLRRLDVTPFAIAKVSRELVAARAMMIFVADYYGSGTAAVYKVNRFQSVLRALALLAVAVEQRLDALADRGVVEPVEYHPAKEWNFAGDWEKYLVDLGQPYPEFSPPSQSADVA
jgi:hypothetical protein